MAAAAAVALGAPQELIAPAHPDLPALTVAQLAAKVTTAHAVGVSGTVQETTDLGLPILNPDEGGGTGTFAALTVGENTLRVWSSGLTNTHLQLLGRASDLDVIKSGADLWTWSSATRSVTHSRVPATPPVLALASLPAWTLTPALLAARALALIDPTTVVRSGPPVEVAGRAAYQLEISPRDSASLIGTISVALDADNGVPLRFRVFPRGRSTPALDITYTRLAYGEPAPARFAFRPPPGVPVREQPLDLASLDSLLGSLARNDPRLLGHGWVTIVEVPHVTVSRALAPYLDHGRRVPGGRAVTTALLSALLTDDGRLYVGAVTTAALQAAAKTPPALPR